MTLADFRQLEPLPTTDEHFRAWAAWAKATFEARAFEFLGPALPGQARPRGWACCLRALIARWATETEPPLSGGERYTVSPETFAQAAGLFLEKCHSAPAAVVRAADGLLRACLDAGATTPEVLSLAAAFAWPLRDLFPETGHLAWQALARAPWQTDSASMIEVIRRVDQSRGFRPGIEIADLARERVRAGQPEAAREWLEAVAAIQAGVSHVGHIARETRFDPSPRVRNAHDALILLAAMYRENATCDQIWSREVIRHTASLPGQAALVEVLERRVWDRPLLETYPWALTVKTPGEVNAQIQAALGARQPHHARRLAEAVLVAELDRPIFGKSDTGPQRTLPTALEKFHRLHGERFRGPMTLRAAAEHLALLYSRTHHVAPHALGFVQTIAGHPEFTGARAPLERQRAELEEFVNATNPHTLLHEQFAQIHAGRSRYTESERRAADDLQHWFGSRFAAPSLPAIGAVIRDVTTPIADLGDRLAELAPLTQAVESAMRLWLRGSARLCGDLEPLATGAKAIANQWGVGSQLAEFARENTFRDQTLGALLLGGVSFLPPGVSVAAMGLDLGASVMLAMRAAARVGAVFQMDMASPDGERFVCDALTLGCSSKAGEGLVAYLSRGKRSGVQAVSLGGTLYGARYLVDYLWTSPGADARRAAEQLIQHGARMCGVQLAKGGMAKVIPLVGAVLSGMSTHAFVLEVREAAIHIATRDALLKRALA